MRLPLTFFGAPLLALAMALYAQPAYAATCTWNNGSANGLWNDAGNWSCLTVPTAADDVIFDGTTIADCTMDQVGAQVASLTMDALYPGVFLLSTDLIVTGNTTVNAGTFAGGTHTFTLGGNLVQAGGLLQFANTNLVFNGTSNQDIAAIPSGVNAVTVNNTGGAGNNSVRLTGTFAINGNATLNNGTLDGATNGAFVNFRGDLDGSGGGSYSGNATFDGTTNQNINSVSDFTFLTIANGGLPGSNTVSFTNVPVLDANASFSINAGVADLTNTDLLLSGDFLMFGGDFTAGPNTTFDGGNQSLFGNPSFNNFTKTVTSAANLRFQPASGVTFRGALTLQGAPGNLLSLISDGPGFQWNINALGTTNLANLSVTDSATRGSINCPINCTDGGNNINWTFIAPAVPVTTTAPPSSGGGGGSGGGRGKRSGMTAYLNGNTFLVKKMGQQQYVAMQEKRYGSDGRKLIALGDDAPEGPIQQKEAIVTLPPALVTTGGNPEVDEAPATNPFQDRVCRRVHNNYLQILERVNRRLLNRFGFEC